MIETVYPIYFAGTANLATICQGKFTGRSYFTHRPDGATFNSF